MIFEKLSYIITGLSFAFILWIGLSWVDVIADNNRPAPEHSKYNFFVVLTETWEDEI